MLGAIRNEQTAVYLRIIRRWWWLPIIFSLVSGAIVYKGTEHISKPTYSSSITLQVVNSGSNQASLNANDASSDALLLTTYPVLTLAAQNLDPVAKREPGALYSAGCAADDTDRFITCTTVSTDYRAAAAALNDLVNTFIKYNLQIQNKQNLPSLQALQQQEKQLKKEISKLQAKLAAAQLIKTPSLGQQYQSTVNQTQITQDETSLSQLTVQESGIRQQMAQAASAIRLINPAFPNPHAIGPHPMRNALLGMILGLGFAAALIMLLEFLDDRFRSLDDVPVVTGLRVLGAIRSTEGTQTDASLVAWKQPRTPIAEAYRVARTNIQFASTDRSLGVLVVTSAREGEGKTTTATNLAVTMALSGRRVLLVDADLHRSGASKVFDLRGQPGLSGGLVEVPIKVNALETGVPALRLVPSGSHPSNPAELLDSEQMRLWIDKTRDQYDLIVIDTPPVLALAETRVLATLADGVVMVVDPSITSRRQAREAHQALEAVGAHILGVIVNRANFASSEEHYSYPRVKAKDKSEDGEKRASSR